MIRGGIARWSSAASLAALLLAPMTPADARRTHRKAPAQALAASTPSFGAFTPASGDPRVAAAFARSGLGAANFETGEFRFTPSGASGGRKVTVAVRAHVAPRQDTAKAIGLPSSGLAPVALNLGASIGWKRFALSGDVAKVEDMLTPLGRESADLGLSFAGKRWATKVDLAADRSLGDRPALGIDQSWSVGVGGSYALTRNLNLTGGVRYKSQYDQYMSQLDSRRDSQAVYLGTTFKF